MILDCPQLVTHFFDCFHWKKTFCFLLFWSTVYCFKDIRSVLNFRIHPPPQINCNTKICSPLWWIIHTNVHNHELAPGSKEVKSLIFHCTGVSFLSALNWNNTLFWECSDVTCFVQVWSVCGSYTANFLRCQWEESCSVRSSPQYQYCAIWTGWRRRREGRQRKWFCQ